MVFLKYITVPYIPILLQQQQQQDLQQFIPDLDLHFHSLLYRKLRFNCSCPKATAYEWHKDFLFFINYF